MKKTIFLHRDNFINLFFQGAKAAIKCSMARGYMYLNCLDRPGHPHWPERPPGTIFSIECFGIQMVGPCVIWTENDLLGVLILYATEIWTRASVCEVTLGDYIGPKKIIEKSSLSAK